MRVRIVNRQQPDAPAPDSLVVALGERIPFTEAQVIEHAVGPLELNFLEDVPAEGAERTVVLALDDCVADWSATYQLEVAE
jgi:hypothetical protein